MNEPGLQDQDLRNILNEMTTLSKSENSKVSLNGYTDYYQELVQGHVLMRGQYQQLL